MTDETRTVRCRVGQIFYDDLTDAAECKGMSLSEYVGYSIERAAEVFRLTASQSANSESDLLGSLASKLVAEGVSRVLPDNADKLRSRPRFRIPPSGQYEIGYRAGLDAVIGCGVLVPSPRGPLLRVELQQELVPGGDSSE